MLASHYFFKEADYVDILSAFDAKYGYISMEELRKMCMAQKVEKYSKQGKQGMISLLKEDFIDKLKVFVGYNVQTLKKICENLALEVPDESTKIDYINHIMNEVESERMPLEICMKLYKEERIPVAVAIPLPLPVPLPVIEKKEKAKEKEKEKDKDKEKEKKKKPIPKAVRKIIWDTYIGPDIIRHRCLCCKRALIDNMSFDCGHIVSEKDGGTQEITNLRPICSACNNSMGTQNMIEYIKTYGFYI